MHTRSEHTGYTTHSTARVARDEYFVACADRFGKDLSRRARQLPRGCMTRVAIEENRSWRTILASAGCERRTPCGVCEQVSFRRSAKFRAIALTAGAATRRHRLGILAADSWCGIEATRAALTAACRSIAKGNVGGRTLAALVLGVTWTDLLAIVDDDLAPLDAADRRDFSPAAIDAWRAMLQVRMIARGAVLATQFADPAPSVRDLSVLIFQDDESEATTVFQAAE